MNDEMMMMNLGIRVERRMRRMAIPVSVPMNVMMMVVVVVVVVAVGGGNAETSPSLSPRPKAWPEQFHALLVSNNTKTLKLQVIDLWYDWPKGRNLNLIQDQLGKKLHDVEWDNGTSFYYTLGGGGGGGGGDGLECRTIQFEVGILRPNWLEGAIYLGQRQLDGFLCNVWYKADFIWYYEDVVSNRPVHWLFYTGMAVHVMTFEVGAVLEDSHWQAPAHCFHGDLYLNNNNNNNNNNKLQHSSSSSSSVIDAHLPLLRHTGTSSSSSS